MTAPGDDLRDTQHDYLHLMDPGIESIVLGTILSDGESAYRQIEPLLTIDDFTIERHRIIFDVIGQLAGEVNPVIEAVAHLLEDTGRLQSVDGMSGLLDVHQQGFPGSDSLVHLARTLKKKTDSRRAVRLTKRLENDLRVHGLNGNRADVAAVAEELIKLTEETPLRETDFSIDNLPPVFATRAPIRYVRDQELPEGAVVALTGDSECGKSSVVTAWVRDAIALQGRPALILDRENPLEVVQDRMTRLDFADSPLLHWFGGWHDAPVPAPDSRLIVRWVKAQTLKPIVVIDTIVAFMDGADENSASEMRSFMNKARRLADLGATVAVIHHSGKADSSTDFRGSSDFKASVDVAFHVTNLSSDGKLLDRVTLRCFKSRYGFTGSIVYHYDGGRFVRDGRTDEPAAIVWMQKMPEKSIRRSPLYSPSTGEYILTGECIAGFGPISLILLYLPVANTRQQQRVTLTRVLRNLFAVSPHNF